MKILILLTVYLGFVASLPWNLPQQVQDTPEVAAAKAAHLAALARAHEKNTKTTKQPWATARNSGNSVENTNEGLWNGQWNAVSWKGDVSSEAQSEDGSWKDDESWKNYDDGSWTDDENDGKDVQTPPPRVEAEQKWKGPIALPPGYDELGAPLPVEDTPEVAAAKAKHLQAYVKVASKLAKSPSIPKTTKAQHVVKTVPKLVHPVTPRRSVPKAPAPVWEAEGPLEDTPEVAAAKAAHYAVHAKLRA